MASLRISSMTVIKELLRNCLLHTYREMCLQNFTPGLIGHIESVSKMPGQTYRSVQLPCQTTIKFSSRHLLILARRGRKLHTAHNYY